MNPAPELTGPVGRTVEASKPNAPAGSLPVDDWQFWVATAVAVVALYLVAKMILPASWLPGGAKPKGKRVTLTIGGKPPES